MFRNWTRAATAISLALVLAACGGSNKNENRIKPVQATLTIDSFPGTPDPAVFLEKGSTTGDLVTVDVKLHTTSPLTFDSVTLEFHFDPARVQIANQFSVNPAVLGDCGGGLTCSPLCLFNGSLANSTGTLLIGVSRILQGSCSGGTNDGGLCYSDPECAGGVCVLCPAANVTGDVTLLTLGFAAATTIDPPGSRIELFTNPDSSKHGDCEILQYGVGPSDTIDLGVSCVDGNATMTAAR